MMASKSFQAVLQWQESLKGKDGIGAFSMAVSTVMIAYLSWRIWAFVIRPVLNPEDPRQMPYAVPFIGHAVSFFKDSETACTRARMYMGNTREPFGMIVAGEQFYIITSPQDASAVYNNKKTLTFDEHIRDMLRLIGSSPDGVEKMWRVSDHLHKNLAHMGEDFYREQLLPGKRLTALWPEILVRIEFQLDWKRTFNGNQETREMSLLRWCRDALLGPVLAAIFGDALLDVAPNLLSELVLFDDQSWKLIYQLPHFLSKGMHKARISAIDSFEAYFKLPKEKRADAAWLVQNLEAEMRHIGINERDIAAFHLSVAWTSLSNAYKLCFWMMAYLLFDPTLLEDVRAEILSVASKGLQGPEVEIENNYPQLVSAYNETLRLTTSSTSIRTVASSTRLGIHVLRPGSKVLLPSRQVHLNEDAFGPDVSQFNARRFMDKALVKSPSFRPFGGGITYCPGRYLARREVLEFVILALHRYDIKLASGLDQAFPKIDEKKPSLGIMAPMKDEDLRLTVQRAK